MKYLLSLLILFLIAAISYYLILKPYKMGYEQAQRDDVEEIMTRKVIKYEDEDGRRYKLECPKEFKKVEDCEWITSN